MPTDIFNGVMPGDIIHANTPNGASCICLVTTVTTETIEAERLLVNEALSFDRSTRIAVSGHGATCTIDSLAPLPANIRETILGLDRRYRKTHTDHTDPFTDIEKKALLFTGTFYAANPITARDDVPPETA